MFCWPRRKSSLHQHQSCIKVRLTSKHSPKRLYQKLFALCLDSIGEVQGEAKYRINFELKSRDRKSSTNVEAYVLPSIIPAQPNQYINISNWNIPENIDLAYPHFDQQERIEVLLVV